MGGKGRIGGVAKIECLELHLEKVKDMQKLRIIACMLMVINGF